MKDRKELCCRISTLALWSLGAVVLLKIWRYQKSLSDPLGAYVEFTLMFLATVYVLALFPIKLFLDRFFSHRIFIARTDRLKLSK
jgi:hypothetical protein